MKKLKIQMNGRSDEFQTPKEAIEPLLPYLRKDWVIWECAWGKGSLAKHLALEGKKRGELYRKYGIQLIIPNKRINFITPSGKGSGAWFQTAWFCYKLNLPKDLMFME